MSNKLKLDLLVRDLGSGVIKGFSRSARMGLQAAKAGAIGFGVGLAGATAGLVAFGAAMSHAVGLANVQEKAEARLASVVKATGEAAGFNAEELYRMAGAFQKVSTVGDEVIMDGMSILATFKNIRGEGFERATQAALDMSDVMQQDLKSSMTLLGKALNDPIKGLSALSRVGVTFTEQQKESIKSLVEFGQTAKAQEIILKELESQFGGSALAATKTFGGAMEQLGNTWGDFKEEIGFAITKNEFFIELVQKLEKEVGKWILVAREWIGANKDLIAQKADEYINLIWTKVKEYYKTVKEVIQSVYDWYKANEDMIKSSLVTYLKGLIEMAKGVVTAFEKVGKAIGFVAAKAAEFNDKVQARFDAKTPSMADEGFPDAIPKILDFKPPAPLDPMILEFKTKASPIMPFTEGIENITRKVSDFGEMVSNMKPRIVVEFEQAYENRMVGLQKALVNLQAEKAEWGPAGAKGAVGIIHAQVMEGQIRGLQEQMEKEMRLQGFRENAMGSSGGGAVINNNYNISPQYMTGSREGVQLAIDDMNSQVERWS